MATSLVMVPVTTYVLGPRPLGVFGLMTAIVGVGCTISLIGSGAVCNMHFPALDQAERRHLVSTMVGVAVGVASIFCLLLLALWPVAVRPVTAYAEAPASA